MGFEGHILSENTHVDYMNSESMLTLGGPQTPSNAAKRFNIHGSVLLNALVSVLTLGMVL